MASTASQAREFAPLELSIDQRGLVDVARVLKSEADGKFLRRELIKALKATAGAPIAQAKSGILSAPSRGLHGGQSLRAEVARTIKPVTRLSGRMTGVSIRQAGTPNLRNFKMAGRRFNRGYFRHPVFGNTEVWVGQTGKPEWFDGPMRNAAPDFKDDVLRVVQELADTLAARARAAARQ